MTRVQLVKWMVGVAVLTLLLAGVVAVQGNKEDRAGMSSGAAALQGMAPEGGVRFVPVDVVIDTGKTALGAYQIEVTGEAGVKIVGLEGSDGGAFGAAPYYDPAALSGNRIVIAAFSTAGDLPRGRTRVARLHLQVTGGEARGMPTLTDKLIVATDAQGQTIEAKVSLQAYEGDRK